MWQVIAGNSNSQCWFVAIVKIVASAEITTAATVAVATITKCIQTNCYKSRNEVKKNIIINRNKNNNNEGIQKT